MPQQYVILWNWTDQGIKNVKEAPKRADTFKAEIQKAGGKVISILHTAGHFRNLK